MKIVTLNIEDIDYKKYGFLARGSLLSIEDYLLKMLSYFLLQIYDARLQTDLVTKIALLPEGKKEQVSEFIESLP